MTLYQAPIGLTLQILEYQAVIGPFHIVRLYQKTVGLTLQIVEYQAVIGPLHAAKLYQKTVGLTLQIVEYQLVIRLGCSYRVVVNGVMFRFRMVVVTSLS